jgi:hypothetical protein
MVNEKISITGEAYHDLGILESIKPHFLGTMRTVFRTKSGAVCLGIVPGRISS